MMAPKGGDVRPTFSEMNVRAILLEPYRRIMESDSATKVGTAILASVVATWNLIVATVWADPFLYFFMLLIFISALDYLVGRNRAQRADRTNPGAFDVDVARAGLSMKITVVCQVFFVRALEHGGSNYVVSHWGLPWLETGGFVAVFGALFFIREEFNSLERHRVLQGGAPFRVWRIFDRKIEEGIEWLLVKSGVDEGDDVIESRKMRDHPKP
jgi:hypothetical protein